MVGLDGWIKNIAKDSEVSMPTAFSRSKNQNPDWINNSELSKE